MPTSAKAVFDVAFDINCQLCPRLAQHLLAVKARKPGHICEPVPPFGDPKARFLIVGLAPGEDGANRTGRPFTGDRCSDFLYGALHRAGFASQPRSISRDDAQQLQDCRITNAVKCLPPGNKPELIEIRTCNRYLQSELNHSKPLKAIMALGGVAHRAVIEAYGLKLKDYKFAHAARHTMPNGVVLFDSFHVSPLNTNTGRLTQADFDGLLADIRKHLQA